MKKIHKREGVGALLMLAVIFVAGVIYDNYHTALFVAPNPEVSSTAPVTISTKKINETNFTGTIPVISGTSPLVSVAQAYIDKEVSDFKKSADTDVPDIRKHFGNDTPSSNYEIDINATYTHGSKTESIVLGQYEYTGGANGNSTYKVFTDDILTGKVLTLSDVIAPEKQSAFTKLLKNELNTWIPEGSDAPVVFKNQVNALTFNSLTNWSMDNTNLIIYFDKYAIGPGSLGPVAFPIPLTKINSLLNQNL